MSYIFSILINTLECYMCIQCMYIKNILNFSISDVGAHLCVLYEYCQFRFLSGNNLVLIITILCQFLNFTDIFIAPHRIIYMQWIKLNVNILTVDIIFHLVWVVMVKGLVYANTSKDWIHFSVCTKPYDWMYLPRCAEVCSILPSPILHTTRF